MYYRASAWWKRSSVRIANSRVSSQTSSTRTIVSLDASKAYIQYSVGRGSVTGAVSFSVVCLQLTDLDQFYVMLTQQVYLRQQV